MLNVIKGDNMGKTIVLNLRVVHLQKFSLVKTIQWMNLTAMLNLQLKNY